MSANTPEEQSRPGQESAPDNAEELEIEESLEESFPASDPPGWTLGREPQEKDTDPPK
jgi:hypothetical protein